MPSTICLRVDLQLSTNVLLRMWPPCCVYFKEKAAGSTKNPSSLCTNIPLSHSIFFLTIVNITTEIRCMNRLENIIRYEISRLTKYTVKINVDSITSANCAALYHNFFASRFLFCCSFIIISNLASSNVLGKVFFIGYKFCILMFVPLFN
jgi:hypothetical protein